MLQGSNIEPAKKRRRVEKPLNPKPDSNSSRLESLLALADSISQRSYTFNESSRFEDASVFIKSLPAFSHVKVSKFASIEAVKAINNARYPIVLRFQPDISIELAITAAKYLPSQSVLLMDDNVPIATAQAGIKNMRAFSKLALAGNITRKHASKLLPYLPKAVFFLPTPGIDQTETKAIISNIPAHCPISIHDELSPDLAQVVVSTVKPGMTLFFNIENAAELEIAKSILPFIPSRCRLWFDRKTPTDFATQVIKALSPEHKLYLPWDASNELIEAISFLPSGCELIVAPSLPVAFCIRALSLLAPGTKYRLDSNIPEKIISRITASLAPKSHLVLDRDSMSSLTKRANTYAAVLNLPKTCRLELHPNFPIGYIHAVCSMLKPRSVVPIGPDLSPEAAAACATAIPEFCLLNIHAKTPINTAVEAVSSLRKDRAVYLKKDHSEALIAAIAKNIAPLSELILENDMPESLALLAATNLQANGVLAVTSSAATPFSLKLAAALNKDAILLMNAALSVEDMLLFAQHLSASAMLMLPTSISTDDAKKLIERLPSYLRLAIPENCPEALLDIMVDYIEEPYCSTDSEILKEISTQANASGLNLFLTEPLMLSLLDPSSLEVQAKLRAGKILESTSLSSHSFLTFAAEFPAESNLIKAICKKTQKIIIDKDSSREMAALIASSLQNGSTLRFHPNCSCLMVEDAVKNLAANCHILLDNNCTIEQTKTSAQFLSKGNSVSFAAGTSEHIIYAAAENLTAGCKLLLNPSIANEVAEKAVAYLKADRILILSSAMLNADPKQQIKAIASHLGIGVILEIAAPAYALAAMSSAERLTGNKRSHAQIEPAQ
ncbi:MAG: hypothetical protein K0S29_1308 [Gammaproteobacteria bacterium]|nr:hypothetical protein [Gammaproteobacteria bacterium]